MVITTMVSYPPESAQEMAKRFLEAAPLPDYMTRKGPYISSCIKDGIIATSLIELDNSKLAEGLEFLGNYMAIFFGVPGFTYEIKPRFEIEEALKMIGMG